ncbi:Nif3-like dinuclear metal center hexameric protein [Longimicrobium sp.]|uniref:Nif3-like dinuclear metal center hexameric protein n=1 Tax=Longimicrobium sp. TaxID=2029185 RepID=UPI002E31945B|nr:Nif3-like dinuclear metal center hexameric protein [Longimicrobium sp.]HEX6040349.1 Nif3-like dinuclear metal center hexameric protein [Longimicrobium sp.]
MPALAELAAFIDQALDTRAFPDEPTTVFVASGRLVARLGLALEPGPDLARWVDADRLDAVFLHRPWRVADAHLPANVGVLASHAAFDHRLTIGPNPDLARDLGLRGVRPFGEKDGRPIGMMGDAEPADPAACIERITRTFGGVDDVLPGRADAVRRIAAVGAMTDTLVRQAAADGAELYVTGQVRQPGLRAAAETGIGIVAVGHARSEVYGLRLLAAMLERRFGRAIGCVVHPRGTAPAHP